MTLTGLSASTISRINTGAYHFQRSHKTPDEKRKKKWRCPVCGMQLYDKKCLACGLKPRPITKAERLEAESGVKILFPYGFKAGKYNEFWNGVETIDDIFIWWNKDTLTRLEETRLKKQREGERKAG